MQQSSLHAALKDLFTSEDAAQEVAVDGYLIDIYDNGRLIEIQTKNFYALKPKLTALLPSYPVHIVHPIAQEKWIVRFSENNSLPPVRRKCPRRGKLEELFLELVRIPHLINHPNLTLEVLLIREEEIRHADGKGSWRRKGVSIIDHRLLEIIERITFRSSDDFHSFLPDKLPQPFTNRDLAQALTISTSLATRITYCLRAMNILEIHGKQKKSLLYKTR